MNWWCFGKCCLTVFFLQIVSVDCWMLQQQTVFHRYEEVYGTPSLSSSTCLLSCHLLLLSTRIVWKMALSSSCRMSRIQKLKVLLWWCYIPCTLLVLFQPVTLFEVTGNIHLTAEAAMVYIQWAIVCLFVSLCVFVCLPVRSSMSICLCVVRLWMYQVHTMMMSVCLFICLCCMFVFLSVCLSVKVKVKV